MCAFCSGIQYRWEPSVSSFLETKPHGWETPTDPLHFLVLAQVTLMFGLSLMFCRLFKLSSALKHKMCAYGKKKILNVNTNLIHICPPLSLTKISPLPPPHLFCFWCLPPSHLLPLSLPSSPICLNITNPPGIPFPLFDSLPVSQLGLPLLSESKIIKTSV